MHTVPETFPGNNLTESEAQAIALEVRPLRIMLCAVDDLQWNGSEKPTVV